MKTEITRTVKSATGTEMNITVVQTKNHDTAYMDGQRTELKTYVHTLEISIEIPKLNIAVTRSSMPYKKDGGYYIENATVNGKSHPICIDEKAYMELVTMINTEMVEMPVAETETTIDIMKSNVCPICGTYCYGDCQL